MIQVTSNANEVAIKFDKLGRSIANDIATGVIDYGAWIAANEQILTYTASTKPTRPAGSTYTRTFRLKSSSRRKMAVVTGTGVKGEWWSADDVAPYNRYVIGKTSQQATIHAGRWKSIEQVIEVIIPKIAKHAAKLVRKRVGTI